MCYSNCPFEHSYTGECQKHSMQNTPDAHCYEGENSELDWEEYDWDADDEEE